MTRAPVTALHQRLADITGSFTATFSQDSPVVTSISQLVLNQGALDDLNARLTALENTVDVIAHRQIYWMWRLMMYGVDNKSGAFVPDTPFARLLVDAKYPDVKTVAEVKGGRGQKPAQKLYQDLKSVYDSDPKKYTPPPDPAEIETFYDICTATK